MKPIKPWHNPSYQQPLTIINTRNNSTVFHTKPTQNLCAVTVFWKKFLAIGKFNKLKIITSLPSSSILGRPETQRKLQAYWRTEIAGKHLKLTRTFQSTNDRNLPRIWFVHMTLFAQQTAAVLVSDTYHWNHLPCNKLNFHWKSKTLDLNFVKATNKVWWAVSGLIDCPVWNLKCQSPWQLQRAKPKNTKPQERQHSQRLYQRGHHRL